MEKVFYDEYGDAGVLKIVDVPVPKIFRKSQLLIKVSFSSLNAIDWKNRKGDFRLVSGVFKPRIMQGFDFVGTIVGKSGNISDLQVGDTVLGLLGNFSGGAISEYILVDKKLVIKDPGGIDPQQLAGLPMAGLTAWQALLKKGNLKKGQSVLINGGSSGVGHLAIQIAKAYGAEVTSVSSGKNLEFCSRLGADHVINYERENFTKIGKMFDIVFDVVFNSSYKDVKPILKPSGSYIGTTPTLKLFGSMVFTKRAKLVAVQYNEANMTDLVALMKKGKVAVHIDRVYAMSEIEEAHRYMELSRTVGKLIVNIAQ